MGYVKNHNSSVCELDPSPILQPTTSRLVQPSTMSTIHGNAVRFIQEPQSYVKLPTLQNSYRKFDIELNIKPEDPDGIILFNGQDLDSASRDYVFLGLKHGHVVYRFELGGGPMIISSTSPIEMDTWVSIKISRHFKNGSLSVMNQGETIKSSAPGKFIGLDLKGQLYIGSVPDFSSISGVTGVDKGFKGCISLLKVGSKVHDLTNGVVIGTSTCHVDDYYDSI